MRKQHYSLTTLLAVWLLAAYVTPTDTAKCSACSCYKVKCSRIETADIDCDDEYKDTCDYPTDITEANNCNLQCDCCLEGGCYQWNEYNCLIFRTFEFFSVLYFLAISANLFLVWHLFKSFFKLKRPFDKADFTEPSKANRNYYKFLQTLWIRRYDEVTKKIIPDKKSRDMAALFGRIDKLKPISFRNLVFFMAMANIYVFMTAVSLYVLFGLIEKPLSYGIVAWLQHVGHAVFYLFMFVLAPRLKSYRNSLNELISAFEVENGCKIRIISKLQLLEINWAPRLLESKISDSKKIVKFYKNTDEEHNIVSASDDETVKVKKVDIKEGKGRLFKSKVTPL